MVMTRSIRRKRETLIGDRLSSLPDALLTHILSLLTTGDSVRTRVLSTRWKYLFASVPALYFSSYRPHISQPRESFTDFINWVLLIHDVPCITSFHILAWTSCNVSDVTSWISAAINRETQILVVDIGPGDLSACPLPSDLFTCQRLVQLKLTGEFQLGVIDLVLLPNLKTLYMEFCIINGGDSASRLFSNCSVLEDLTLSMCHIIDVDVISISLPSLKRLEMHCLSNGCEWKLSVPNLEFISLSGATPKQYMINILKSLYRADICLEYSHGEDYFDKIQELVNKFVDVQFLSLSGDSMEFLAMNLISVPRFNKIKTLELSSESSAGWSFLPTLLEISPCLERLTMKKNRFCGSDGNFSEIYNLLPKCVPPCFSRTLKEVTFCMFDEEKVEYKWLVYLLENAKVLEKLTIFVRPYHEDYEYLDFLEKTSVVRRKLLAIRRRSKNCKIVVNSG